MIKALPLKYFVAPRKNSKFHTYLKSTCLIAFDKAFSWVLQSFQSNTYWGKMFKRQMGYKSDSLPIHQGLGNEDHLARLGQPCTDIQ